MNILGQPFAPWVTQQINIRQNSLGNNNKQSNPYTNLLAQNGKTPWIRLASTVNITQAEGGGDVFEKLLSFGFSEATILGDNVAKNFILQGGVTTNF